MSNPKKDLIQYAFKNVTYVNKWREFLDKQAIFETGLKDPYAIKSNIAYAFHYLQFLEETLRELPDFPNTAKTMLAKTHLVTGSGIVESLFYCLLHRKNFYRTTEWKQIRVVRANDSRMEEKLVRLETVFFEKLDEPIDDEMTFDSMSKKIESRKLLGDNPELYAQIRKLRKERNRLHLHETGMNTLAIKNDWDAFGPSSLKFTQDVVLAASTAIFEISTADQAMFAFLKKPTWVVAA